MNERDRRILEKIVSEISYLDALLEGVDEGSFLQDETMERAAAVTAINVGELAKRLSDAFFQEHPSTDLRLAAKTRDMYAHGYFTLSFAAVFKTAREDYPRLRDQVELLLRDSLI